MSNINDIFNPKGTIDGERPKKNSSLYKPSFKDGKQGVYKSIIRFIPNYEDPSKCIYEKYVVWVKNPVTSIGMYIDDPRSIDEHSVISQTYFRLKNTEKPQFVEAAKNYLGSKKQFAALVQILKDEQHPELEGKIKVFTFGQQIWDKIHNEEFPPYNENAGLNPFNPIVGRHFQIVCTSKSGFNNFEQSTFFDERNADGSINAPGMWFVNPASGQMEIAVDGVNGEVIYNYLKDNSPKLSDYGYNAWSDEQTKHVTEVISILNNYLETGTIVTANDAAASQASGVIAHQGVAYQPNPVFPGATPMNVSANPVTPTQPVHQMFSSPTAPTPQIQTPQPSPIPQNVVKVEAPQVRPLGSNDAKVPGSGIDMSDFLKTL